MDLWCLDVCEPELYEWETAQICNQNGKHTFWRIDRLLHKN